jgi:hypothetical protein
LEFNMPKGEIRVPSRTEVPLYAYTFPRLKLQVLTRAAELKLEPNETGTFKIPWFEEKRGVRWYCRGSVLQKVGKPSEQMLYVVCDTEENIILKRPPEGWTFRR